MSSEPLADVRDMYMAHAMFRREIGLAPTLIRAVPGGDVERAQIVADHIDLVEGVLHHHHLGEDEHLWDRLVVRAGAEAEAVVKTMETQHHVLGRLLDELRSGLIHWRTTAEPAEGAALAEIAADLSARLAEHLDAEEELALPLISEHITAAEWGLMVSGGAAGVAPEKMPLIFGLMAYGADPDTLRDVTATIPQEIRSVLLGEGERAYAEYAQRVYGAVAPEHAGVRSGGEA